MEADESVTPRTGRKKKSSALSKLAARGRRKIEDENDSDTKSPSSSMDHKYPIDANVEIRNNSNVSEVDSDEGIEVTTDSFSHGFSSYAGPNSAITSLSDRDWVPNSKPKDQTNNSSWGRDKWKKQNPNDLEKHMKEKSPPLGSDSEETSESNKIDKGEELNHVSQVRQLLDSEKLYHEGTPQTRGHFKSKNLNEDVESAPSGPFRSSLTSGSRSRSNEDLTDKYKHMISKQEGEESEKEEMSDNVSALRSEGPKTLQNNMRGATTTSLYSSQDRPWGSMNKFGGFDTLSQRSFQSTSVLPLITTKEARDRSVTL